MTKMKSKVLRWSSTWICLWKLSLRNQSSTFLTDLHMSKLFGMLHPSFACCIYRWKICLELVPGFFLLLFVAVID
jgi:hypothetical protein